VKLAVIRDALDRAGITAKQALELSAATEPKPYDDILADIAGVAQITRAESGAARGLPAGSGEIASARTTHPVRRGQ
jgi:hypothetical protein